MEHLAFNATKEYTNHDLVNFLESIGCEFGACNNAYTSYEETVYELLVPVDKPDILSRALHVFAQFSTEVNSFLQLIAHILVKFVCLTVALYAARLSACQ